MTLIVEDGTIVDGANSMASVAQADAYHAARGNTAWAALEEGAKHTALINGSASMADATRYPFKGMKTGGYSQRQPWPRAGVVERHGDAVPDNAMPWQVVDAVCYLAGVSSQGTDLNPDLKRGGKIKQKTIGPITTIYADNAPTGTIYQAAYGILAPLLRDEAFGRCDPNMEPQWGNDDPSQFDIGMHDNLGRFNSIGEFE